VYKDDKIQFSGFYEQIDKTFSRVIYILSTDVANSLLISVNIKQKAV